MLKNINIIGITCDINPANKLENSVEISHKRFVYFVFLDYYS